MTRWPTTPREGSPAARVEVLALLLATLAVAMLAFPDPAAAWVRTQTCTPPGDDGVTMPCRDNDIPLPLYWDRACIGYHVQQEGLSTLGIDVTRQEVDAAFGAWDEVECSWMRLQPLGLTDEDRVGFDACGGRRGNANVVLFREDRWPHGANDPTIALTSVTYVMRTGEILDADIELNASVLPLGIVEDPLRDRNLVDLRNALTHEVGHLLGLDHTRPDDAFVGDVTTWRDATMFALTRPGETIKRTLHEDDRAGVCAIYPADIGHPDGPCPPAVEGFFQRPDAPLRSVCQERSCRCGAAPAPGGLAGVLIVLAGLLRLRRRAAHP